MESSENNLLRSLFDQKLDRAVLVSFFLGAVVPLIALALVAVRYGLPALENAPHERMTLVFGVVAVAILTLASCLALHRLSTAARARMDGDNARLNSLVAVSRSLAEAKDPQAVTEASTPCARRIANAKE